MSRDARSEALSRSIKKARFGAYRSRAHGTLTAGVNPSVEAKLIATHAVFSPVTLHEIRAPCSLAWLRKSFGRADVGGYGAVVVSRLKVE